MIITFIIFTTNEIKDITERYNYKKNEMFNTKI